MLQRERRFRRAQHLLWREEQVKGNRHRCPKWRAAGTAAGLVRLKTARYALCCQVPGLGG